jgi:hypothetical protein
MMTVLDNNLVNVLHTERRVEAAHERVSRQLVRAPRDCTPRVGATWVGAWNQRRMDLAVVTHLHRLVNAVKAKQLWGVG